MTETDQIKEKIAALQDALLSKHPTMPTLLRDIHTLLNQYPEQVVLLTEEEISVIVSGLKDKAGITLAASVKAPSAAKSLTAKLKTQDLSTLI